MTLNLNQNFVVMLEILVARWQREFFAALPEHWQSRFGPKRWILVDDDNPASALEHDGGQPTAIALRPEDVLVREVELPLASTYHISKLMEFEAPRHIPLPLDQTVLDFRIVRRDLLNARAVVEVAIFRRDGLVLTLKRLGEFGIKAEAIYVQTKNGPWLARRAVTTGWRDRWFSHRHQTKYLRAAVPLFLFVSLVFAAQNWASRLATARSFALATAQAQAAGTEPLKRHLEALRETFDYLAASHGHNSAAAAFEEVARLLPDDAWLQELDVEGQTVRMLGKAQEATSLLRDLYGSRLFTNAQFEAPLTQADGTTGDQFDIVMSRQ